MNYQAANALLGNRDRRKVANNTYLIRRDEEIGLILHDTEIITWDWSGSVRYNTGGWNTVTTKNRLNRFGPYPVWQKQGVWFTVDNKGRKVVLNETMRWWA